MDSEISVIRHAPGYSDYFPMSVFLCGLNKRKRKDMSYLYSITIEVLIQLLPYAWVFIGYAAWKLSVFSNRGW